MTVQPVVKTIRVDLPPAEAFALFTTRIGEWWPVESHSVSGNSGHVSKALHMGEGIGAELVETAHDGTRHVWGEIREWTPGEALAFTWHPGRTDGVETQVRVVFDADAGGTRVTLTHSGWDALGKDAAQTREGYNSGWDGVLARFAQRVTA